MDEPNDPRPALTEEVRVHNENARQLFSIFITWWSFVCTANTAALVAVLDKHASYQWVAPTVAFFDFMGSGFCLLISIRLVQVQDRVRKILQAQYGATGAIRPNLPAQPTVWGLVRAVFGCLAPEPSPAPGIPSSPIPLSFYLWCLVPVTVLACPLLTLLWLVGWWSKSLG